MTARIPEPDDPCACGHSSAEHFVTEQHRRACHHILGYDRDVDGAEFPLFCECRRFTRPPT